MSAPEYPKSREAFAKKLPFLRARAAMLSAMKGWFKAEGFDEVDTPSLQLSPGMEVHLRAFKTEFANLDGSPPCALYLHTSPEFAMKKLLALGLPRIFQFAHVFRNEVVSPTHYPEFTMLEWYRAEADYTALMDDCDSLLALALEAAGKQEFSRGPARCKPLPAERLSVAEVFDKYAGFDLFATIAPGLPVEKIAEKARKNNINVSPSDTWDDIFEKFMLGPIEPNLGLSRPTILYDYPLHMAALSRQSARDPRLAERFELYVCGVELANAFSELTDAAAQAERFKADAAEKKRLYGIEYPVDFEFLEALSNMPEAAGAALGFDRLVMLATGAEDIREVLWSLVPSI